MFHPTQLNQPSAKRRAQAQMDSLPAGQSGAVLAISLIFLLVITVLALSNMSGTGLEEKMTANLQASNIVFNGAESSIQENIDNMDLLSKALASGTHALPEEKDDKPVKGLKRNLEAVYVDDLVPTSKNKASTLVVGKHGIKFYYYELKAESTLASFHASTTHTQGVYTEGTSFGLASKSASGGMSRNN